MLSIKKVEEQISSMAEQRGKDMDLDRHWSLVVGIREFIALVSQQRGESVRI